jgi:hypothetical protein
VERQISKYPPFLKPLTVVRNTMRLITILIIICLTASFHAQTQNLASNLCDSSVLTQQEYEICKADTIFNNDINVRTNYIIFLKTNLLPKYRIQRKALILPDDIKNDLKLLKIIYDSTVAFKLQRMALEMDSNQKYVQPKAYLSSLLALEIFKFYPDVYAVLLNEIHLRLNPKTNGDQMKQIQRLVDKIASLITNSLKDKVQQITSALTKERKEFTKGYPLDLFQGNINDEKKEVYNIINFLLWTQ